MGEMWKDLRRFVLFKRVDLPLKLLLQKIILIIVLLQQIWLHIIKNGPDFSRDRAILCEDNMCFMALCY